MQCADFWEKHGCEEISPAIVSSVKLFKQSQDWTKDGGQYIPAPLVWLRKNSWEAPIGKAISAQRDAEQDLYAFGPGGNHG